MVSKYDMLNSKQKAVLKSLGIRRNITTVYDLQYLLIPFFEVNNNKYFLSIQTIQLPTKKETINTFEIDKIGKNVQPCRIYFRYFYTNNLQDTFEHIDLTNDKLYLSKIDAILYILEKYLSIIDSEKKEQMLLVINNGELGELYNENKKWFKLDKLRKVNYIKPKYKYRYVTVVDFMWYGVKYNTINYTFTHYEDEAYKIFSEYVNYKRFNLYRISDKILSNNIQIFRKLILEDGLKFQYLDSELKIYFCVSGMNIYYIDACDIGILKLIID